MKIGQNQYAISCEISGCKNIAENRLILDGELEHDTHICKKCLEKLFNELSVFLNKKKKN